MSDYVNIYLVVIAAIITFPFYLLLFLILFFLKQKIEKYENIIIDSLTSNKNNFDETKSLIKFIFDQGYNFSANAFVDLIGKILQG